MQIINVKRPAIGKAGYTPSATHIDVAVNGPVQYHLRFYTDGTFDVFAHVDGRLIAIGGVGTDGIIADTSLAARRDAVERAHERGHTLSHG